MSYIVIFLGVFFLSLIVLYFVLYYFNLKKENIGLNKGLRYIVKKYNLKMDQKKNRLLTKILVVVNSFILSIPLTLFLILDINYYLALIISFGIFIVLFLIMYNLVGIILRKKGW